MIGASEAEAAADASEGLLAFGESLQGRSGVKSEAKPVGPGGGLEPEVAAKDRASVVGETDAENVGPLKPTSRLHQPWP